MIVRRLLALVWVILALLAAAYVGVRFQQGNPVETDILALLPQTERNPNAENAVNALASQLGNRAVFLIKGTDGESAKKSARAFAEALRHSGAFSRVTDTVPDFDISKVTDTYLPYRPFLLSPADRQTLQQPDFDVEAMLLRQMHMPVRDGIPIPLHDDPFGFLQRWLSTLPLAKNTMRIEDDLIVFQSDDVAHVLVVAELPGSAFDTDIQTRVKNAVTNAQASLHSKGGGIELLRTGAVFFGEAARSNAQSEIDLIGGGSLVGILLLLWLMFRSVRPLALGMLTVAIGVIAGTAAVLGIYDKLHIITIVFGASLIGEAVDYSIQYFAAHVDAGTAWDPVAGLRRILPGLAIALATSLLGYGALSLTPFPAVSQIALFAFAGLASAWVSVVLILPFFLRRPCTRDMEPSVRLPRLLLQLWRDRVSKTGATLLALAVIVVAAPGWWLLKANDDIRQLINRPESLIEQENVIRRIVGGDSSARFFLVEGSSDEQALQREEALTSRLRTHVGNEIAGYVAVSDFVPSAATQQSNRHALSQALPADKVTSLLAEHSFRDEHIRAWQSAFSDEAIPFNLDTWSNAVVSAPVRHQILSRTPEGTALLVTLRGDAGGTSLEKLAHGLPGITFVDKTTSVSALFARYRSLAITWLPAAILIVTAVLVVRYGLRRGLATLLPPLLAMVGSLGVYGFMGASLTLFTMMGLVLVLGVGVNYVIFLVEAGDRAPAPFAGVILSAATTILSFGLLSLSSMPALHQFGLILLVGVGLSLLLAPIALTLGKGNR